MKYLVIGGGGFIGASLCDELLKLNKKVRILDFKESINTIRLENAGAEVVIGDFQNSSIIESALSGVDIVFHLVSTTVPKTSKDNHVFDVQSNVIGTLNLLNLAKEINIKKIVFSSSGGTVYGVPQVLPIKETHPTDPIISYGITKLAIEKYLHMYRVLYGLDYTVLRIANAYGAGQKPTGFQGVIPAFIHKVLKKEEVQVWGDGSVVRDYVYISDIVSALISASEYEGDEKIFNIGRGQGHSLDDILAFIKEDIDKDIKVKKLIDENVGGAENDKYDVPVNVLDVSLASEVLNWQPQVSIEDGIIQTYKWMKNHYQTW